MKKVVYLAVAMLFAASVVFAQAGSIGIFGDPMGTDCNLQDLVPGLCTYHVVHVNSPGATACQFWAPVPACFLGTYLSDTALYPVTIGNSQTGVAVGFGACIPSPNNVLDISFFCQGLTGSCCYYQILPDPAVPSGQIEVVDCVNNLIFATGGEGIINADGSCQCDVPAEDSTWGKVKSLYAE
ncbi:MAG: hypothetical protein JSW58_10865 [Candidatus Latescibacterota bacterium]|nr:MAG: hypothetical protein JSW58_10865 [Candidatus Latescibacterota bacterium]